MSGFNPFKTYPPGRQQKKWHFCIRLIQTMKDRVSVRFMQREGSKGPHKIANWARVHTKSFAGLWQEGAEWQEHIRQDLDPNFVIWRV